MLLFIQQIFILYLFLFYSYFYFIVDEEFMIFLVIIIWLLFFSFFYLKGMRLVFVQNMKELLNEYFFFHNKRNFFLSIIRDQFFDVITIYMNINFVIDLLIFKLAKLVNKNLFLGYKNFFLVKMELINLYKKVFKNFLSIYKLTFVTFFYKLIFLLLNEINIISNLFFYFISLRKTKLLKKNKKTRKSKKKSIKIQKTKLNFVVKKRTKIKLLNILAIFQRILELNKKKAKVLKKKMNKKMLKNFRIVVLLNKLKKKVLKKTMRSQKKRGRISKK